jgi:hypothetical protein
LQTCSRQCNNRHLCSRWAAAASAKDSTSSADHAPFQPGTHAHAFDNMCTAVDLPLSVLCKQLEQVFGTAGRLQPNPADAMNCRF